MFVRTTAPIGFQLKWGKFVNNINYPINYFTPNALTILENSQKAVLLAGCMTQVTITPPATSLNFALSLILNA